MCQFIESICVMHGKALHTDYHQYRVERTTAKHSIDLHRYIASVTLPQEGCHKLRIRYSDEGITDHTLTPYVARTISSFQLVEDNAIEYSLKREDRATINQLMTLRGACDDIIIVRHGLITDSSYANLALHDGSRWITPHMPLLEGTCRARLIHQGILTPEEVKAEALAHYSHLMLINAMLDFDPQRALPITDSTVCRKR